MIKFNVPPVTGRESKYIQQAIQGQHLSGDGFFTQKSHEWLEENIGTNKALLTTSCTHALEMAALLIDTQPGDEVIMPSYTFVSTANAFVLRGAKIVFVDIRPDTMNLDETKIEAAITPNTKAIVPVHYAGVGCEMDTIMAIAEKYDLYVIEDAAQGMMSTYKGKMLGTIGHMGTYSFHETKNYVSGEGGALLINDEQFIERAEIIREKGTNRSQFLRGQVDKYTWQDVGSSYLMSELNAAFLYAQFENAEKILKDRLNTWLNYYNGLTPLADLGHIELPVISNKCTHNGHMFYVKTENMEVRTKLIEKLKETGIQSMFHYIPLHTAPAGMKNGEFNGQDEYTTSDSRKLVRLPLYYNMSYKDILRVIKEIKIFYENDGE